MMAAVFPKPCSTIKFRTSTLALSTKSSLFTVAAAPTANSKEQVKNLHHYQLITSNEISSKYGAVVPSSRNSFAASQVLVKEYENEEKIISIEDERLEEKMASVIMRLRTVVERVRETEMEKYISKVGGTAPFDNRGITAEEMSMEIVNKFLQKPIQYLRSRSSCCHGRTLEEKLKDVNLLAEILENSCPMKHQNPCP